ncbi:MAG: hypothetical protein R3224_07125, partial [Balneolaceae bacterium]|nr:hypothetical protein [Balneolaceae bacterium]
MMAATGNRNTYRKKRRRWPWLVPLALAALLLLARLSLKTPIAHRLVRAQIVKAGNAALNARLDIGDIEGDLWKEIRLVGVSVVNTDTVITIDTLYAAFDLYSYFSPVFRVRQLRAHKPDLRLVQSRDDRWNVEDLLKPSAGGEGATSLHWKIEAFSVAAGEIDGSIASFDRDSVLALSELAMEGVFGYYGEEYELQVRELAFQVEQTRLTGPVRVQTEARSSPTQVTLENLLLATGTSMIRSSAAVNLTDSTARLSVTAEPLSWRDISAYLDRYPSEENLQLDLGLKGNVRNFELTLNAEADGLRGFELASVFSWTDELVLERLDLTGEAADLGRILSNSGYPRVGDLRISLSGYLPVPDYRRSELTGSYRFENLRYAGYRTDLIEGSVSVENHNLKAVIALRRGRE